MTRPVADDHITGISPYVPGKQVEEVEREYDVDDVIKLASNENPLGPSPDALDVLQTRAQEAHIYPDGSARALTESLADFHDLSTSEILTGNGSDQMIRLAVPTLARAGEDHGLVSQHAFGAYPIALQAHDVEFDAVPMQSGLRYDLETMREYLRDETRLVFIANPNNPTGTHVSEEALRAFLRDMPDDVVVVVDEAYHQYARAESYETALNLRDCHDLLVVTRTFSKCYGLAGARVGYAIAPPDIIDAMNRVRAPFNCNRLAQHAAVAALEDRDFVERAVELNESGREQLEAGLSELEPYGIDWIPSQTNFLLVETPIEGRRIYESMLRDGVIVRPVDGYGLPHHLRISIGTPEENERCLASLEATLRDLEGAL